MTVETQLATQDFLGAPPQKVFPNTYKIFKNTDVQVFVDGVLQTLTTDYTVDNIDPDNEKFDITFVTAPGSGAIIVTRREMPQTQEIDYLENDAFPAETHEEGLDRAVMLIQQLAEELDRSLTIPPGFPAVSTELPVPSADKFLAWNSAATAIINAVGTIPGIAATAFGSAVVQSVDAAAGRVVIDVYSKAETDQRDQDGSAIGFDDTGAVNAMVITPVPAITAYKKYQKFRILVANTNTGAVTLDVNGLGVQNVVSPATGSAFMGGEILAGSLIEVMYDGTDFMVLSGLASISTLPQNHISGFQLSNEAGDPSHDIEMETGECTDSTDAVDIRLTTNIIKQIDANWAEGTNMGGFPSALTLLANTAYHFFVIIDTDTGNVDAGFDTSLTAANLLIDASAYDNFRRVGTVYTDGSSNIIAFQQFGDRFDFNVQLNLYNSVGNTSGVTLTCRTPPGVEVIGNFAIFFEDNVFDTVRKFVLLTATDMANIVPSATQFTASSLQFGTAWESANSGWVEVKVDTNRDIRHRATSSTTTLRISQNGYCDPRGKK